MSKKSIRLLNLLAASSVGDAYNLRKQVSHTVPRHVVSCAENESSWKLDLTVDDYPWETRWTIKDPSGNKIAYGPPDGENYVKRGDYQAAGCLPAGDYMFTIKDQSGDGLCCSYGDGRYAFEVDGLVLAASDDSAFKKLEFPFTVENEIVPVSPTADETGTSSEINEIITETKTPTSPRSSSNPSKRPTNAPSLSQNVITPVPTGSPSIELSQPPSPAPSVKPTHSPLTPWPTYQPSATPTEDPTDSPSFKPTQNPTSSPSISPISSSPTYFPSMSPTTSKPTGSPIMTESELPSKHESATLSIVQSEFPSQTLSETTSSMQSEEPSSEVPSIAQTEGPTTTASPSATPSISPTTPRLVVSMTPFSLYLTTNTTEIDLNELDIILTDHLFEQMQTNLPKSTEVSKVDLVLTDMTTNKRDLKKDEATGDALDSTKNGTESNFSPAPTPHVILSTTTTHEISVSGDAYFAGPALPTTEQLDDTKTLAFEGDAGNELIDDLLSANDPGLRLIVGMSLPIGDSDIEMFEGFLYAGNTKSPSSENAFNTLYVVGAVFVVGLLLVAVFIHRTMQNRRDNALNVDDFVQEPNNAPQEEEEDLPTFINVIQADCEQFETDDCEPVQDCVEGCGSNCFFDGIHIAPSQASTEVASNQTGLNGSNLGTLNTKGETLTRETLEVTHADGSTNRSSLSSTLYKIQENEEDTNGPNIGLFCGMNNPHSAADKQDEKSRFGTESQWGLKPVASEDTSTVQKEIRCSTACHE